MNSPLASPHVTSEKKITFEMGNQSTKEESKDVFLASVLFSLVGIGYLFPFSALTQPVDYWNLLFPDFNIEFPLTSVYMYTNLVMLALLVFCGGVPDFTKRIVGGFVGQLLVLIIVPTSYFMVSSEQANMYIILLSTAFAAIVTAFLDSSVIALAAQFPLRVQEAFQLGIGLSTLIGSIYRDVTKLVFPPDAIVESSLLYFYSGAFTIALCIGAYFILLRLPLSKACFRAAELEEQASHESEKLALIEGQSTVQETKGEINRMNVLRKILFNECMVSLLFISTLALWPPLVTEIKSYNFPNLQKTGWWPLILLTGFSGMDCIGRFLVRFRCGLNKNNIWIPVVLRFVFFPLIICSVKGVFFTHDAWSVLFVACLGFTNGYIGTLTIVLVNECISTEEQAIAGTFTSFFLNTGLVLGASAGLIMEKMVIG